MPSNTTPSPPSARARPPANDNPQASASSWRAWVLGWVIIPGAVAGTVFLAGVHYGATHPDAWLMTTLVDVIDWLRGGS